MSSNNRLYIILGIIALIIFVFIYGLYEFRMVPDVHWKKDYQKENKDPYGTWLFHNLLKEYYPQAQFVDGLPNNEKSTSSDLYIKIAERGSLKNKDVDSLEAFINEGNVAIIIFEKLGGKLDSLQPKKLNYYGSWSHRFEMNFEMDSLRKSNGFTYQHKDKELENSKRSIQYKQYHIQYNYEDEDDNQQEYQDQLVAYTVSHYQHNVIESEEIDEDEFFVENDKDSFVDSEPVIEELNSDYWSEADGYIVVKNKIGDKEGAIYFCTVPEIFTNIALQQISVADFNEELFHAINISPTTIYWDDEQGIYIPNVHNNTSPLQYILSQKSLKWAYYVTLISGLLFIIFRSKRRQKIIPLKEVKRNTSLEHIDTISKLYFSDSNHLEVARHMEKLFYHKVERKFFLPKDHPNFVGVLAKKSRLHEEEISLLLQRFEEIKNGKTVSTYQLRKITTRIENILQT